MSRLTMDQLPEDIIAVVFGYLPFEEITGRIELVCKSFSVAARSPLLWRDYYAKEIGVPREDDMNDYRLAFFRDCANFFIRMYFIINSIQIIPLSGIRHLSPITKMSCLISVKMGRR